MNPSRALLVLAFSVSSAACAVDPSGVPGTEPLGPPPSAPLSEDAPWPPKVDIPVGAKKAEVCAHDDGDVQAQFVAMLKKKNLKPVNVTDVSQWPRENGVPTCRNCFIPYATIHVPREKIRIVDSYAENVRFVVDEQFSRSCDIALENVYARGAAFDYANTTIYPKNSDLRCSTRKAVVGTYSTHVMARDADDVDLAGSEGGLSIYNGSNVRLTGAAGDRSAGDMGVITLTGAQSNVRFDGMENTELHIEAMMTGTTRFDGATGIDVRVTRTTFSGGRLTSIGAKGRLFSGLSDITFDHVDLSDAGGDLTIAPDLAAKAHVTPGTNWTVGPRALVPDDRLTSVNLTGANLVTREAKWPSVKKLDGLVLTGGRFPDQADLSQISFEGAHLEKVHFANVILSRTDNGIVKGASFKRANLQLASLGGVSIDQVDFSNADIRGATLDDATGSAKFVETQGGTLPKHTGVNGGDERIDTSYARAKLGKSTFTSALLQYAAFSGAELGGVDFTNAHVDFAHFDGASFVDDGVPNATLAGAANMHAVDFSRADLRGVSLAGVELTPLADEGGTMQRSSLRDAWLCGGDLSGAKLGGANLSGLLIEVDGSVVLPDGSTGTCAAGKHEGAQTLGVSGKQTMCPLHGSSPADDGQCSAEQWRVPGTSKDDCEGVTTKKRVGFPCQKSCECTTDFCSGEGSERKCADR